LVIGELEKATSLEEISWRQKSRALWLKEGDKGAWFFVGPILITFDFDVFYFYVLKINLAKSELVSRGW
jgi:hypothetical protein